MWLALKSFVSLACCLSYRRADQSQRAVGDVLLPTTVTKRQSDTDTESEKDKHTEICGGKGTESETDKGAA